MCAADKPFDYIQDDSIVHDSARQRAWRAAKLKAYIENQTPSEIMQARTGLIGERFGIDGDLHETSNEKQRAANKASQAAEPPAFDLAGLAKVISEEVFLLPEQGIVFTRQQLAKELGITALAMEAMTDQGYERLGLIRIKPEANK